AVRNVSWQACVPHDTATISLAVPASFRRIASSTAISSKGFIDILTLAVSTPEPSALTRTLTLKSTTRLTGTRIFMLPLFSGTSGDFTAGAGQNRIGCGDAEDAQEKPKERLEPPRFFAIPSGGVRQERQVEPSFRFSSRR